MGMKRGVFVVSVLGVLAFGGAAWAQEEQAGDKVVYRKKTVIDLSGAVIEGELTKPEGSYIVNRKVSRFSTLITLRENYVPELLISPDQL
jgi:hypothetical protein